ncbi:CDP-diacylglycerol--serine O-phosphatidyltransferase [Pseudomonas sp. LS1212]|uniref:CDP-diacylglycerol--serine O-phosphatidyltransferase n=1 Tax=Pseudomonas sp. LS1212 TaxID=2972478 RepID=UPI00215CAE6F|nr:CDP-diacylglycerol--serine O-phosphatidyltransferase [Pseudomonas sp. LS1212]UVJ41748.1 CDP-diacylglycerol--serine O-phosphatidyltransferase [Pseudomonas sp. LS1212]
MRFYPPKTTLAALRGFDMTADSITILPTAADYRRCLLEHIASARRRIYITALYLQKDESGQEIIDALYQAKAARPTLDIVVMVDWFRAQRGLLGAGKQPGNAAWYRAERMSREVDVPVYGVPIQTRELFGVLHLKGNVIDDCVIYSGASISNVYLHKFDKYRLDRYHVLYNKPLADSVQELIQNALLGSKATHRLDLPSPPMSRTLRGAIRAFRSHLKRASYDTSAGTNEPGGLRVIPLLGVGRNNPLSRTLCQLVAASQKQLTLCTPYFNLAPVLTREIDRALKRGVTIDIIIGDKTSNDFFIPPEKPFKLSAVLPYFYEIKLRGFARKHQDAIARHQLNLQLWKEGDHSFHLKGVWVDQRYTLLTGNNLNPRGFRLDLENALLIDDPQAEWAVQRDEELAQLSRHTRRVDNYSALDSPSDYPPQVRTLLRRVRCARIGRLLYGML